MEQNKDQGSAAVRALPSDLTEREQITLLCQVETYMSITEKHSQTAPEAGAEENRMYGLVNGFIAKRFSDIGAAVRGEAVAVVDSGDDGLFVEILLGDNGSPLKMGDKLYLEPVSARAADAPSEPSESYAMWALRQISQLKPEESGTAVFMAKRVLERAADALDSQPTSRPIPWEQRIPAHVRQIGTACSEIDYVKAELAEWRASSHPTDGGVRNG